MATGNTRCFDVEGDGWVDQVSGNTDAPTCRRRLNGHGGPLLPHPPDECRMVTARPRCLACRTMPPRGP